MIVNERRRIGCKIILAFTGVYLEVFKYDKNFTEGSPSAGQESKQGLLTYEMRMTDNRIQRSASGAKRLQQVYCG
jgi:hypothetical protein